MVERRHPRHVATIQRKLRNSNHHYHGPCDHDHGGNDIDHHDPRDDIDEQHVDDEPDLHQYHEPGCNYNATVHDGHCHDLYGAPDNESEYVLVRRPDLDNLAACLIHDKHIDDALNNAARRLVRNTDDAAVDPAGHRRAADDDGELWRLLLPVVDRRRPSHISHWDALRDAITTRYGSR